jgi:4-hydroxy-3-polyprenylbenzoate decarboxylase
MRLNNLREFIALLEERRQLARIRTPVSAHLEITEITDRVSKGEPGKNKALLFENVSGYQAPVLINAFGNAERMALALGVENLDELNQRLGQVIDPRLPRGMREMIGRGQDFLNVLRSIGLGPKKVRHAPVQEVINQENPGIPPDPAMLAAGCRPFHHLTASDHPRSGNRRPQRRHVPLAGSR